jgi:hypothetical protein
MTPNLLRLLMLQLLLLRMLRLRLLMLRLLPTPPRPGRTAWILPPHPSLPPALNTAGRKARPPARRGVKEPGLR